MGLFKPAWQSKNDKKAVAAIEKIEDQAVLAKIVTSGNGAVNRAALDKITDQTKLLELARNGNLWIVFAAIEKLTNEKALAELAVSLGNSDACLVAAKKITSQELLAQIVQDAKDQNVCENAASRLTDQALLMRVVEKDRFRIVGKYVAERLNDLTLLTDLITTDKLYPQSEAVEIAAARISDQTLLERIAKYAAKPAVIEKITSSEALVRIVKECKNNNAGCIALAGITSVEALEDIAISNSRVAFEALKKLTEPDAIRRVAKNAEKPFMRVCAMRGLDWPDIAQILKECPLPARNLVDLFTSDHGALGPASFFAILPAVTNELIAELYARLGSAPYDRDRREDELIIKLLMYIYKSAPQHRTCFPKSETKHRDFGKDTNCSSHDDIDYHADTSEWLSSKED